MEQSRTARYIRRGVIVLLISMLVFSIVSMIITKLIYDRQFSRVERHDESVTAGLRYSDLEEDYPRQIVRFLSSDNWLQGYIYGNEHTELGVIVVAHGLGGGADSYLSQIRYFVDHGWRVFAYDATGSFDSEGKSTRGFPQSILDMSAALEYIRQQTEFDNLPVMLFGHSWGGYAAANQLHFDFDVAGVVTAAAANSAMDMIMEQGHRMMGGFVAVQYPFLWMYQSILFGQTASLDAASAIEQSNVPVLVIHGIEDAFVNYSGSSIPAHLDLTIAKQAQVIIRTEDGQNNHNDLFRSKAAINYINELNVDYRALYDQNNQNIPYDVRQSFYSTIDRSLAQDLDLDLMNEIESFYRNCLTQAGNSNGSM